MRFITLDVFRGITVFLMIIVNTAGSGAVPFPPLLHAEWHGCTLTDLVFPAFLFAVGNSISFSAKNKMPGKIIKRMLLIFILGYLLTWLASVYIGPDWSLSITPFGKTRILAVLQRIALAYGAAALMALYLSEKKVFVISILLLIAYWLILKIAGDPGMEYTITGNAVRKLDLMILGEDHMYKERGIIFDPEGLLSTIPAIVNVTAGFLAGKFIQRKGKTFECMALLLAAGNIMVLLALTWSLELPLNKKLWTSSYVLYTSGISLIAVGILLYFYEIRKLAPGRYFFGVFGKNPLFIYVLATLLGICFMAPVCTNHTIYTYISEAFFQKWVPGPLGSLFFAIAFTLLCWMAGYFMDRKKIYIRL